MRTFSQWGYKKNLGSTLQILQQKLRMLHHHLRFRTTIRLHSVGKEVQSQDSLVMRLFLSCVVGSFDV